MSTTAVAAEALPAHGIAEPVAATVSAADLVRRYGQFGSLNNPDHSSARLTRPLWSA